MIRAAKAIDEEAIQEVWLLASLQAHDFIPAAFWWQQQAAMRARYFPAAEIWVCERAQEVQGFVALIDDYLAALFVRPDCQQQGIGRALLDFAKQQRTQLSVTLYCENDIAVNFYLNQGFTVLKEGTDAASGQPELYLQYRQATDDRASISLCQHT
ncbi:GNAT family N-acetyltransferase [Oceanisphaera profunda]|uniref:GNAT family N-acetyltransferase n=1 Tax=Oceanisphaera profunda TaxID=1416627 RepID=A0A1Y0D2D7_9GAMM|nr:GNAT family N-acetyltransferase [Oceanisphaera profunda]ART81690.1 GNAT family N-acetyltransferase [Oceanisphaera profunda]